VLVRGKPAPAVSARMTTVMTPLPPDFRTDDLGECQIPSPLRATGFMDTSKRLLFRADIDELRAQFLAGIDPPAFELAGPQEHIYFEPGALRCGVVTCGGLCPGLNDVIRSIVSAYAKSTVLQRFTAFDSVSRV
jgi:6-phosphofructokinase 1